MYCHFSKLHTKIIHQLDWWISEQYSHVKYTLWLWYKLMPAQLVSIHQYLVILICSHCFIPQLWWNISHLICLGFAMVRLLPAIVITHVDLPFVFYPCLKQLTVLYLLQNNLTQSQDKALRRISEMKEVNCFNLILNYQLKLVISSKSFSAFLVL